MWYTLGWVPVCLKIKIILSKKVSVSKTNVYITYEYCNILECHYCIVVIQFVVFNDARSP